MEAINDVVVTSRVRLARNLDKVPFPHKLGDERALTLAKKVYEAACRCPVDEEFDRSYSLYRMGSIAALDGEILKEKHLISADLLGNKKYGAAIINESETVSIMVGEEDHIREQCIMHGLSLIDAYKKLSRIDDELARDLDFAYDGKLGYLTCCPTNLGTGMRASAMMFLPGLSITENLEKCVNAAARLNMTVRGVYGEGSDADGYLYQISNQKTLGVSEAEIVSSVQSCIKYVAEAEFAARRELMKANRTLLTDKIMRAYGILTNAYTLDSKEFMELLAMLKLGVHYGIIEVSDRGRLEKLVTDGQPANILGLSGKDLDAEGRDLFRAAMVARTLKGICGVKSR